MADTFVGSGDKILIFWNFDSDNATPKHVITGANTGLSGVVTLALDPVHREIWAAGVGDARISVFSMDSFGDVAPVRTIEGAATGLTSPRGLLLDLQHDEVIVTDFQSDSVLTFPRTQNGDGTPLRTLSGPTTGLHGPLLGFLDLVHDELYIPNFVGINPRIAVFARTAANGDAPLRTLEGGASAIDNPRSTLIDLKNDLLIVSEYDSAVVRAYPRAASGGTAPIAEIGGGLTLLEKPYQLAATVFGNLIVGTDTTGASARALYHVPTVPGDVAPDFVLMGAATLLANPTGVASDFAKDCSWGNSADGCLFRDNFESNDLCYWSHVTGGTACP